MGAYPNANLSYRKGILLLSLCRRAFRDLPTHSVQPIATPKSIEEVPTRTRDSQIAIRFPAVTIRQYPSPSAFPIHTDHRIGGGCDRNRRRFAQVAAGAVQDVEPGGEKRYGRDQQRVAHA